MPEEKLTSVKRFGTRYGRTLKLKFGTIEVEQRKKHICPYCHKAAVKRQALGIWECRKCDAKFAGRAYTITKKQVEAAPKEQSPEQLEEEPQEEEEQEA